MATHLAIIFMVEDILKMRPTLEGEGIDRDKIIFVPTRMAQEPPSVVLWCQAVSL